MKPMQNQMKPSVKITLQILFGLSCVNSIATLGYLLSDLVYNKLGFSLKILIICLISSILWAVITVLNKKFNLKL